MRLIKETCRQRKVSSFRVNPLSQPIEVLMGRLDPKTREFNDGIFASIMRRIIN